MASEPSAVSPPESQSDHSQGGPSQGMADPTPGPPPPAYAPSSPLPLRDVVDYAFRNNDFDSPLSAMDHPSVVSALAAFAAPNGYDEGGSEVEFESYESDSDDAAAPVVLRINTSIYIGASDNLVCLPDTPAGSAGQFAVTVADALRDVSHGRDGIPMVDEFGRPRRIVVEVDASVAIRGCGNIVGPESTVQTIIAHRREAEAARKEEADRVERVALACATADASANASSTGANTSA